jgi:CheY-like chemotaxis protein
MRAQEKDPKTALLVCPRGYTRVQKQLVHAGYRVTKVDEGTAAIERAKHELLDAAVLVSTGTEMDLAETVLNLKDIIPNVEVIIIADSESPEEKAAETAAIVQAFPGTRVLTISELARHLAVASWQAKPAAK